VFTLLTGVIFFCSVLTYVIPSGSYVRETRLVGNLERNVVVPDSYESLPKHITAETIVFGGAVEGKATPVSVTGFLSAIPRGMSEAGEIIFFIFILGAVFGILQRTGTIVAALQLLLSWFRDSAAALTVVLMTAIAVGGSTLGMGEEFIPLVPIFLLVSKELGYDRIYGLCLVMVAADIGFASATTNPFTVNIAQGIAELPLNSLIPFRAVFFVTCLTITIAYVLRYGARIKKDPSASYMADDDFDVAFGDGETPSFDSRHLTILVSCLVIFGFILYAVQEMGWWLSEMAGGFLLMGLVAIFVSEITVAEAVRSAVKGMEDMVVAALVVGVAKGIEVVLSDGQVMDTLIFSAASVLQQFPNYVAAAGMLVFQTTLNFFVPSGSGQAAVTMPLMAPLADVLGLTRQTAVFAFTCGDGFSNTIIPTSGVLMAMLSLAGIPFERWIRFMFPLFLILMATSTVFLFIMVAMGLE
jgi:uncharacterized ion transporter superfamily protein YfcC